MVAPRKPTMAPDTLPVPARKPTMQPIANAAPAPVTQNDLMAEIARRRGAGPEGSDLMAEIARRRGGQAPISPSTGLSDPLGLIEEGFISQELADVGPKPLADDFLKTQLQTDKLGKPGFDEPWARALVGLNASFEDKRAEFRSKYPDGDLIAIPVPPDLPSSEAGETIAMYRRNANEPWARFDEPGLALGDVSDISRPLVIGAAQAGAAAATSGSGFLLQGAGQFAAGAGTDLAISGVQGARGISSAHPEDVVKSAVMEGILGTVGYTAGIPLGWAASGALRTGAASVPFGSSIPMRGMADVSKEGAEAVAAARAQGFIAPYAFQVAENPLIQRIGDQALQQSTRGGQRVADQFERLSQLIKARVDPAVLDRGLETLNGYQKELESQLKNTIAKMGPFADPYAAGLEISTGWNLWNQAVKAQSKTLYDAARAHHELVFDLAPLKTAAQLIEARVATGAITTVPTGVKQLLDKIKQAPRYLTDQFIDVGPGGEQIIGAPEILDVWRGHAYKAGAEGVGYEFTTDRGQALAKELMGEISRVFNQPLGLVDNAATGRATLGPSSTNVQFVNLWDQARALAKDRFETIETMNILINATKFEVQPVALANQLMASGSDDAVRELYKTLRSQGLESRWITLQSALKGNFAEVIETKGADAAERLMQSYSPRSQALLFGGAADREAIRTSISAKRQLEELGFDRVLRTEATAAQAVLKIAQMEDKTALRHILTLPEGHPLRETMRNGLLNHLSSFLRPYGGKGPLLGKEVIDNAAVKAYKEMLENTGAIKILHPGDIKFIDDAEKYTRFVRAGSDITASLAGGETASAGMRALTDLDAAQKFTSAIIRSVGFGRLLTSPWGRTLLVGSAPGRTSDALNAAWKASAAIMTTTANSLSEERKAGLRGVQDVTAGPAASVRSGAQHTIDMMEDYLRRSTQ